MDIKYAKMLKSLSFEEFKKRVQQDQSIKQDTRVDNFKNELFEKYIDESIRSIDAFIQMAGYMHKSISPEKLNEIILFFEQEKNHYLNLKKKFII